MARKLTITVSDEVYRGLHSRIGQGRISRFIDALVRPHVVDDELDASYRSMAGDADREAEALEWTENLSGRLTEETR